MFTKGTFILSNKWDKRYLELAERISKWSKDPSSKIGCVAIGEKGQVLAQCYNGFPRSISDNYRLENREIKLKYIVHAEMNTIFNAAFSGISLEGSTFYVVGLPCCSDCAKGIVQVGVKRVVMPKQEITDRWKESWGLTQSMFTEAGVAFEFI